jgi:hypothetical protein
MVFKLPCQTLNQYGGPSWTLEVTVALIHNQTEGIAIGPVGGRAGWLDQPRLRSMASCGCRMKGWAVWRLSNDADRPQRTKRSFWDPNA